VAHTLGELAALLGGKLQGPADLIIQGIAAIDRATPGDITFISEKRYARLAAQSLAAAFIVGPDQADLARPLIIVPHPYLAYAQAAALFAPPRSRWPGVSPLAFLGQGVELGQEVSISPLACIGNDVRLGDRVTIMPGCVLGDQVQIGADTLLYPHVTILERCTLGQRVIVHSGTVIGSDGFGFVPGKEGHQKIPQLGIVVIEDDVEIGANCAIDRGALGVQAGLVGHIELGDGVQVAAQSGVPHSVPAGLTVSGSPARPHLENLRIISHLAKLPEIYQRLKDLEKRIEELAVNLPKEHQE
jgi:UDP-3-O-[3-hydroxymyristoyl] glucosamine N-acyltransferase